MKRYVYRTERELEGLKWVTKIMDFGISLTVTVGLNEMLTAYVYVRNNPLLYRHRIKQLLNQSDRCGMMLRTAMFSVMRNRDFFNTYSDRVIDLANEDIGNFRTGIESTLLSNGNTDVALLAQCETARVLLNLAKVQYVETIGAARRKYGYDYGHFFNNFNSVRVAAAWDKFCDCLYDGRKAVDLNTEHQKELFDTMSQKFIDGIYIQQCLKDAHIEHPMFTENNIIDKR